MNSFYVRESKFHGKCIKLRSWARTECNSNTFNGCILKANPRLSTNFTIMDTTLTTLQCVKEIHVFTYFQCISYCTKGQTLGWLYKWTFLRNRWKTPCLWDIYLQSASSEFLNFFCLFVFLCLFCRVRFLFSWFFLVVVYSFVCFLLFFALSS